MLGLGSVEDHINQCKLLFLRRLIILPNDMLSKKIFLFRLTSFEHQNMTQDKGFIKDALQILQRYDLEQYLQQFIQKGCFPGKVQWKGIVQKAIMTYEQNKYVQKLGSDPEFVHFLHMHPAIHEPSRIWRAAQICPKWSLQLQSMAKVVTVSREAAPILCELCGRFYTDIVAHFVTACDSTHNEVEELWNFLSDELPVQFGVLLYNVDDLDFISIILGAPIEIEKYHLTEGQYLVFLIKVATFWHRNILRIMAK